MHNVFASIQSNLRRQAEQIVLTIPLGANLRESILIVSLQFCRRSTA